MIVSIKSFLNRFIEVDTPRPRELFSSALNMRNQGFFSPDDELPVVSGRTLDNIDDLLNYDKMRASDEANLTE